MNPMILEKALKKEVDASVWADKIEWSGDMKFLTLRCDPSLPMADRAERWKKDLENVQLEEVTFALKNVGRIAKKDWRSDAPIEKRPHVWATFEVVEG